MSCVKAQGVLARKGVATAELVPASRKLGLAEGIALLAGVRQLIACKGKNVERFDLKRGLPERATLKRVLLGPTGNLRAPLVKAGNTVIVGFNEGVYADLLK
jgi:hypothetical protein